MEIHRTEKFRETAVLGVLLRPICLRRRKTPDAKRQFKSLLKMNEKGLKN